MPQVRKLLLEEERESRYLWRLRVSSILLELFCRCTGKYNFINNGVGKGDKITFAQAWEGFEKSLTSARIPCTSIERYPIVARWRNDVDFVAAGIFCFQPYCVTGELDPPANPLICP